MATCRRRARECSAPGPPGPAGAAGNRARADAYTVQTLSRRLPVIRLSDVRYGLRLWRRHPAMVIVAGLSLGLGVGATTTMYSVVNRVANYELGFAGVDRLVVLWST